jgi:general secretion pathway protein L
MSTLVIQLSPRTRLRARGPASDGAGVRTSGEYAFVTTNDGFTIQSQGQCAPALLPKAVSVVAVLAETDVAWHRITLPKAPASRMRAALVGVLEDSLLEDAEDVHLALAPTAAAGQLTWVAAVDRAWLSAELAALEKAEVFVDRVVPMTWPDDPPSGHFAETAADESGPTQGIALHWAHPDGVASLRLDGALARAMLPQTNLRAARWSANPATAAAAEAWLGVPVSVMPPGERSLQAARSLWNLRQFDLVHTNRGARAMREGMRKFFGPAWRPARWGLAALVVLQLAGLNLWAWQQRSQVDSRRLELQKLVKATFPRVTEIELQRDTIAVMEREAQALRAQAGRAGDTDLETMLNAAASAWPADRPPVATLRYEPGKLTLAAAGWSDAQVEQFRSLLTPSGWRVEAQAGLLTLRRTGASL